MITVFHASIYLIGAFVWYVGARLICIRNVTSETTEYTHLSNDTYYYLFGDNLGKGKDFDLSMSFIILVRIGPFVWPAMIPLIIASLILGEVFRFLNKILDGVNSMINKADKLLTALDKPAEEDDEV